MPQPIADALVLVMPERLPLGEWHRTRTMERYWAVFKELRACYGRLVVVTPGTEVEERDALASVDPAPTALVCNACSRPIATVIADVRAALGEAATVVMRTIQVAGCHHAVDIAHGLRESGRTVGLIARSGFVWSKFAAFDAGPHSSHALEVGRREGQLCRAADIVAATTQRIVDDLAWRHGLDPTRCVVIPNYVLVDQPSMAPVQREQGAIITVGPLVKRRRVPLLLQAMAELADIGAHLTIIGEGPEEANLRDMATQLGAPVTFVPHVEYADLLARLTRCSIYVQASELEGHPKTVLEAMACGAAVIVTESQGQGSVVHHGVSGLRVAADHTALAHAMRDMLGDPDWRDVLGASASRMTLTNFGLPTILNEEIEVHRRVVRLAAQRDTLRQSA